MSHATAWNAPPGQGWPEVPLKYLAANVADQISPAPVGADYIALDQVEGWTGRRIVPDVSPKPESSVKRYTTDDVLFCKLRPYLAKVYLPDSSGVCTGEMLVLRPLTEISRRYLGYLLRAKPFIDLVTSTTSGARMPRAEWSSIGAMRTAVPTRPEQDAIVAFLDCKMEQIDRYLAVKRQVIEHAHEQRSVTIEQFALRGPADLPTRPARLTWIGAIPAHWDERQAKYYMREVDERSKSGREELLSVSHITGVTPRSQKNVTMFMAESYVGSKLVQPGDLAINTMWAWMCALGVARQVGIVSPAYGVYRQHRETAFIPDYLDYLLRTKPYAAEYRVRSTGIRDSRLRLYPDQFLSIPLVCPPKGEQVAICAAIERETSGIKRLIEKTESEIDLMTEYRTTLIAEAVCGRLDVRRAS